MLDQVVRLA